MKNLSDERIIESWQKNVTAWIEAIRHSEIQSRVLVTNRVIVATITRLKPGTVLDLGCGEGWLVRELCKHGIDALGVDVIPKLVAYASQAGPGRFRTLSYAQLAEDTLNETFDLAVANFSLLGRESVTQLFQAMAGLLDPGGHFVVQTLHPVHACGEYEYKDGWREGSWAGFNAHFRDPAPWYFRTLESWQALFSEHDFVITEINEPINPQTGTPASVIFVGQRAD